MSKDIRIYEVANTDLLYVITDNNKDAVYYDKNTTSVQGIDGKIILTNNGSIILSEFPSSFLIPLENSLVDLIEIIQGYLSNLLPVLGDLENPIYASLTNPLTAFGEVSVANNTAFIQNTGVYGLIPSNFREYTSLSGTTGVTDRMFTVTTGTSVYGYGAIQSFRALNYNAGQGGMARFTALFQNNVADSWSGVGLVNLSDEISFGYNGTSFGVWHRYGGIAEVRTIAVTGASGGSTNLTLTLDSIAYTIPLTTGTVDHNAYEIATWLNNNQLIWVADQLDDTVIISALSDGSKSGAYSYSHASSTGTITQNTPGETKTSNHIEKSNWNGNTCLWLDTTKGNVYQIAYQYLGFGDIKFYVEYPETGTFILAHTIKYANSETRTSLNNPSLRFGMYGVSLGSIADLTIQCASVGLFVQGSIQKTRNPRAVKNTQTVSTSFTNILTLRNRRTYNYLYNQVEIEPLNLGISSESTKNVEIEIRTNSSFSGDTNFTSAGTNLVGDIDTTNNTTSNGRLISAFTLSGGSSVNVDLKGLEIRVPPSLTITIAARVTSGANASVTSTLTYYEDL